MPTRRHVPTTIPLDPLEWRSIGPFRGGRVEAVAGDPVNRNTFYFGSGGGGVWKTIDGGLYWRNVSDGFFKRASVGAIAVAPSDPNVIYAGMGEACIRNNVSHGDGVYRSTDAGKTWSHLGLADTRHIAKVRVDPRDPDIAFVAALGHAHGPSLQRGIFRTRDGGRSWKRVLSRGPKVGAIDLSIDPTNPRILYASLWEAVRLPHRLISGGGGSGVFKSTDAGDTWREISRTRGLPEGALGKIGIAVSPALPDRIFALVEAVDGGIFRSDDGGRTWLRGSDDHELRQRPFYFTHIYADPLDSETVWALNFDAYKSTDAGRTFALWPTSHPDSHDLWIDPRDSLRMINGNDGGASVSFDGGVSWSTLYNQPTGELYHVTSDSQFPYRLYAAQQDNTSISVPSRSTHGAIMWESCYSVGGGEAGHIAVRADDPQIVFAASLGGLLTRYDHGSQQVRVISVWPANSSGIPAKDLKYRFNWTAPVLLSPHDPAILYTCSQYVHRTRDEGTTWERISPDLTRNDKRTTGDSGGPITKDNVGSEYYATIFAFAESPLQRDVLWAGSDDGLIHLSRDGGITWANVTPRRLGAFSLVSTIEPGQHDPAAAYVAANRYKHDDFAPYLYKTANYGRTWTRITSGIPTGDFTRVIREDPEVSGLLVAGTETGLYISYDAGGRWSRWQGKGFPVVAVHDLIIKDSDVCVATHGRGFWLFDDIAPLREIALKRALNGTHLFEPGPTTRYKTYAGWPFRKELAPLKSYHWPGGSTYTSIFEEDPGGERTETNLDAGKNPPDGVLVTYYLDSAPTNARLKFHDGRGRVIRTFRMRPRERRQKLLERTIPAEIGMNRFVWDLRYPGAARIVNEPLMEQMESSLKGPVVPPGLYTVQLEVDGERVEVRFEIQKDPRITATISDLTAQFSLLLELRNLLDQAHLMVNRLREALHNSGIGPARRRALRAIEARLMQPKAKSRLDTYNFGVRLNNRIAGLIVAVANADALPTRQQVELAAQLESEVKVVQQEFERALHEQAHRRGGIPKRARRTQGGERGDA